MIVGDADSQFQSNTRFRDHLLGLGIDPHFQVLPGVEHVAGSYLTDGSGLRFLSDHFTSVFHQEGDYDRSGLVDAGDYISWKNTFGSATQLSADGNENGVVDGADYVIWRHQLTGVASVTRVGADAVSDFHAVPEAAPLSLAVLGAAVCLFQRVRVCKSRRFAH